MILEEITYGENEIIADLGHRSAENNNLNAIPGFKKLLHRELEIQAMINKSCNDEIRNLFSEYQDLEAEMEAVVQNYYYERGFIDAMNIVLYVSQK